MNSIDIFFSSQIGRFIILVLLIILISIHPYLGLFSLVLLILFHFNFQIWEGMENMDVTNPKESVITDSPDSTSASSKLSTNNISNENSNKISDVKNQLTELKTQMADIKSKNMPIDPEQKADMQNKLMTINQSIKDIKDNSVSTATIPIPVPTSISTTNSTPTTITEDTTTSTKENYENMGRVHRLNILSAEENIRSKPSSYLLNTAVREYSEPLPNYPYNDNYSFV
jgi:cytoskeletal protein RodZ